MTVKDFLSGFSPFRIREDIDNSNRLNAENPRLRARWALRSRRRIATVLMGALVLAAALLLGWLLYSPRESGSLLLSLGFLAVMAGFLYLLTQLNRAMRTGLRYRHLDERQRIERDHATRFGHNTTGALLGAVFLMFAVIGVFSPEGVQYPHELVLPLVWLIVMVHTSVPCAYLAWTQPDEIPDDEDETAVAG